MSDSVTSEVHQQVCWLGTSCSGSSQLLYRQLQDHTLCKPPHKIVLRLVCNAASCTALTANGVTSGSGIVQCCPWVPSFQSVSLLPRKWKVCKQDAKWVHVIVQQDSSSLFYVVYCKPQLWLIYYSFLCTISK